MSRIDGWFDIEASQADYGRIRKKANILTPADLFNARPGNDSPELVNNFARSLKKNKIGTSAKGGIDYLRKETWNQIKSEELLKPVTKKVTKVLGQYLDQVAEYKFNEPLTIMEFGLKEKFVIRGTPSKDQSKNGKLNAVELVSPNGKTRVYRRINPSHIKDTKVLQGHIDKIQKQVGKHILDEFEGVEPLHTRWTRLLKEKRNEDLWIPVDSNTGDYLINNLDLEHQLRNDLAVITRPGTANRLAQKYGEPHIIWREIANQEIQHKRVQRAMINLKRRTDDQREVKFIESIPAKPNETGSISSHDLRDKAILMKSHDEIMQSGLEQKGKKKEKQDYIWIGRNRAGLKAFALYDGVSNVGKNSKGKPYLNRSASLAKSMANAVRKTRSGDIQEMTKKAENALYKFNEKLSPLERAAATGVAAVVDKDNVLRGHMRGDVRVYVCHIDGQADLVTPIQNIKTRKLYEIMEQRGISKAEAKEVLKKEFQEIENSPKMYRSNKPGDNVGFEFNKKLKKGDVVMFFSDGVFDHTQTKRAEDQLLIDAAESNNPAEYLISEANRLYEQYNPEGRKDDYSAGYMVIS